MASNAARTPVLVAFRCPVCQAEQGVDLTSLVRLGTAVCTGCGRKLNHTQVSRAIERTRAHSPPAPPTRRGLWA